MGLTFMTKIEKLVLNRIGTQFKINQAKNWSESPKWIKKLQNIVQIQFEIVQTLQKLMWAVFGSLSKKKILDRGFEF